MNESPHGSDVDCLTGAGVLFVPADSLVFENHVQQPISNLSVGCFAIVFDAGGE